MISCDYLENDMQMMVQYICIDTIWVLLEWWDYMIDFLKVGDITVMEYEMKMALFWNEVLKILESHPEEASFKRQGDFPLHRFLDRADIVKHIKSNSDLCFCFDENIVTPPIAVYKKLIEYYPKAVFTKDSQGFTALDHAMTITSSATIKLELIQMILQICPQALSISNQRGYSTLHRYACGCYNSDRLILPTLVRQVPYEFVHQKDDDGWTPLACLCRTKELINCVSPYLPIQFELTYSSLDHPHLAVKRKRTLDWIYVYNLLVIAAATEVQKNVQPGNFESSQCSLPEIHSAIFMQCPYYLMQFLLELYPHQLAHKEPTFGDVTPLGMILTSNNISKKKNMVECDNVYNTIIRHRGIYYKRDFIQRIIYKDHNILRKPCTSESLLPLHQSLSSGNVLYHDDAIDILVRGEPRALLVRDPNNHFYPFLLAACNAPKENARASDIDDLNASRQHLDTVYALLREVPWLLGHFKVESNCQEYDQDFIMS